MSRVVAAAVAVIIGVVALLVHPGGVARAGETTVRLDVQVVQVDGLDTAWAQVGWSSGRALLLLNGTGSPMSEWDPALLGALADRGLRVVVYDYPGLGQSAALPGRLDFDRLAEHAAGLMAALDLGRADVLGWSMGGFVAQRLVVRRPEAVRALVLAGTNPGGSRAVLGPRWVQQADSDPDAAVATYVRTNYPPGSRSLGWAFVNRVRVAQQTGAYPPSRVPASTYRAMVEAEDPWLASDANLADLRGVGSPVLVVTGDRDVVTPPANSRVLAAVIPGARLMLWPHAGHSFLFQEPSAVATEVAGFLGRR